MDNLGQYLKGLREAGKLLPEMVLSDIKLTAEQIENIESNNLTRLGDRGISRALVYTYARYLNADTKRAMSLFELTWPPLKQVKFTPRSPMKEKKVLISTNFIWMVAIGLFVLILASILYISYERGYLSHPIQHQITVKDSIKVDVMKKQVAAKPDSVRLKMLKITQAVNKPQTVKPKKLNKGLIQDAYKDTTDYVNQLNFQQKDSPFNPRW